MDYQAHIPLNMWAEDDRPREKMTLKGVAALSDAELIAILLRSGTRNLSAVQLAQRVLQSCQGELSRLARMDLKQLQEFPGMGLSKAASISAAFELARRRLNHEAAPSRVIRSSADAFHAIRGKLCDLGHEEFWVIILDRANKIVELFQVSKGGVSGTVVDHRLIFRRCIQHLASGIILAHNHPSAQRFPSEADIQLTRRIKEAAALMDIQLLDHIIAAGDLYYSFADEGKL